MWFGFGPAEASKDAAAFYSCNSQLLMHHGPSECDDWFRQKVTNVKYKDMNSDLNQLQIKASLTVLFTRTGRRFWKRQKAGHMCFFLHH